MAQRLVRAKRKIRRRGIPYRMPATTPSCPTGCGRCSPSSTWSSTRATPPPRATSWSAADLCAEAIRLARLLRRADARRARGARPARAAAADRVPPRRPGPPPTARWCCWPTRTAPAGTGDLIAEGQALVRALPAPRPARARTRSRPRSPPCTATRRRPSDTDWAPDRRAVRPAAARSRPTPVVALNRAVALAEVAGPAAALAEVDGSTWTATTCSTPPGPTCCAGSAAPAEAGGGLRPGPGPRPTTRPSGPISRAGATT